MDSNEDGLVLYKGHWYKPISSEQAGRIRKDIPLYAQEPVTGGLHQPMNIEDMRYIHDGVCSTTLWKSYLWYIQVDPPDKEEYTCEQ